MIIIPATLAIVIYTVFALYIFKGWRRIAKLSSKVDIPDNEVWFSVVIPFKNEQNNIHLLINDLKALCYDNFEVIFVNDNSTDQSFFFVEENIKGLDNFRVINNDGEGKKRALLTGVENSSYSVIVTTDADCRVGDDWLTIMGSFYQSGVYDLVFGPVLMKPNISGRFYYFQAQDYAAMQTISAGMAGMNNSIMCSSSNMAFDKRFYLNNISDLYFNTQTGDDVFLLHAAKREHRNNICFALHRYNLVTTNVEPWLSDFVNQRKRWGAKGRSYRDKSTVYVVLISLFVYLSLIALFVSAIFNPINAAIGVAYLLYISILNRRMVLQILKYFNKRDWLKHFATNQLFYIVYFVAMAFFSVKRSGFTWKGVDYYE